MERKRSEGLSTLLLTLVFSYADFFRQVQETEKLTIEGEGLRGMRQSEIARKIEATGDDPQNARIPIYSY